MRFDDSRKYYTLTIEEIEKAKEVVRLRCETAKKGCNDYMIAKNSDFSMLNGAAGEIAFGQLSGLPVLLKTDGVDPYDAILNGVTIDSKTTPWEAGRLLVRPNYGVMCHVYALMIGNCGDKTPDGKRENLYPWRYYIAGLMWANKLIREERCSQKFMGAHSAEQHELISWEDFKSHVCL